LRVYQATDYRVFWTAQTYGTELQNRIWNFEKSLDREPQAYFFHEPRREALYIGKEVHREDVARDPRYRLIASDGDDATTLYVARSRLAEKNRGSRLAEYYRRLLPALVEQTAPTIPLMEPDSVVAVPFPFAAAYLVHEAEGRLRARVEPLTTKDLDWA